MSFYINSFPVLDLELTSRFFGLMPLQRYGMMKVSEIQDELAPIKQRPETAKKPKCKEVVLNTFKILANWNVRMG